MFNEKITIDKKTLEQILDDDNLHELKLNNDLLKDLIHTVMLTIPDGYLDDTGTITITDKPKNLLVKEGLGSNWHAVAVINDGSNSCFVNINTSRSSDAERAHEVKPNEEFKVDFGAARIRLVHLFCNTGETTTIRLSGTR